MPKCNLSNEDLIAHLDNKATGTAADERASHIRQCPVCQQRLREFAEVDHILQRMPLIDDPSSRMKTKAQLALAKHQNQVGEPHRRTLFWFWCIFISIFLVGLLIFLS